MVRGNGGGGKRGATDGGTKLKDQEERKKGEGKGTEGAEVEECDVNKLV